MRLSIDADLNYCEPSGKPVSSDDREIFESAIRDVADELGYKIEPGTRTHAGRTMKLVFESEINGSRTPEHGRGIRPLGDGAFFCR